MKKFIVIVNNKYAVSVIAESSGGAEHKILDDVYYGVETCQAFSLNELDTDFFVDLMQKCETIGFSELVDKSKEQKERCVKIEALKRQIEYQESVIKDAQRYIDNYRGKIKELQNDPDFKNFRL